MKLCLRLITVCLCLSAPMVMPIMASAQDGILKPSEPTENDGWNILPETAEKLNGGQLHTAFSGITHKGQYRFLREENSTFAFIETTNTDGTLTHIQGPETLTGIWDINNDLICYTYDKIWTYPVCFNIYKSGTCYYHLIRSSNGVTRYGVTARSTPSTQRPDCDALTS